MTPVDWDTVLACIGPAGLARLRAAGYEVVPATEAAQWGRWRGVTARAQDWALRLVALFAASVEPGPHPLQGRVTCPVCDWERTVAVLSDDPRMAQVVEDWVTAEWLAHVAEAHRGR
jgi:hypothetical protein